MTMCLSLFLLQHQQQCISISFRLNSNHRIKNPRVLEVRKFSLVVLLLTKFYHKKRWRRLKFSYVLLFMSWDDVTFKVWFTFSLVLFMFNFLSTKCLLCVFFASLGYHSWTIQVCLRPILETALPDSLSLFSFLVSHSGCSSRSVIVKFNYILREKRRQSSLESLVQETAVSFFLIILPDKSTVIRNLPALLWRWSRRRTKAM